MTMHIDKTTGSRYYIVNGLVFHSIRTAMDYLNGSR